MLEFKVGAEEMHARGVVGVKRIREWLDATGRFRISRTVYDIDPRTRDPYSQVRVPLLDGTFERFDLFGQLLEPDGGAGRNLYVESKFYGAAGNQGALYEEYLAVCYSAFAKATTDIALPASMEFMWATTHPFAQETYTSLCSVARIQAACTDAKHAGRLGGCDYDPQLGTLLSERLWISIINPRVEEMIMGPELRKAVVAKLVDMGEL